MFEDLFGEEKTYEIFQGKTNIMKCTTAVKDLAKAKLEHDKLFQETLKEITGLDIDVFGEKPLNREQRRARKNIINELKYFNRLFTYNNRSSRSAISN